MSSTSLAHERLRSATHEAHKALEDALDAVAALSSPEGRRRLAPRYLNLHAVADGLFDRWLSALPGLDGVSRRRAPIVRADLAALGVEASPRQAGPPPISSLPEALGFFYVVEGSTLGGRMILRQVAARGADLYGLGFLDPYGARTGEAWRGFLGVLDREVADDPVRLGQAEAGATAGFAFARACLCEPALSRAS